MIFRHMHEQLKNCFNSDHKSRSEISAEFKYSGGLKAAYDPYAFAWLKLEKPTLQNEAKPWHAKPLREPEITIIRVHKINKGHRLLHHATSISRYDEILVGFGTILKGSILKLFKLHGYNHLQYVGHRYKHW